MPELFWTKKPPAQDGWYWWRRSIEWEPQAVHVRDGSVTQVNWRGHYRIEAAGGEWYGPLVPPGGDAIENCRQIPRQLNIRPVRGPLEVDPEVRAARLAGYEGEPCPHCGERKVVRSGTLHACDACGQRWEKETL